MRLLFPAVALVVACMALLNGIMGDSLPNPSLFEATVQPVAAAGLLALCISVILGQSSSTKRIWRLIGAGLALFIVTVGLLELFDTIFGSGIGLTSRLFPNVSLAFGPAMAPNTAFCFVILGTASIFSRPPWSGATGIISHRAIVASQALACTASLIALLAIIGHIYHAGSFVAIHRARPMTMETAFCFAFLAISVLQIHLDQGLMRYVVTNGPGGYMARLLLPVSVLLPVGLGWLRIMGMRAQLFDAELGIAFSTLLNVIMLFGLTLWAARKLFQMNEKTRQVEAELIYRATHDSLTGLVNRAVFRDQLLRRLKMIRNRRHSTFAVLYLDLDGFKQVNDFFGHDAGDRLLVEVGNILRKCIRVGDTVARFGGDEFVILCDEIESREDASQLAARIVAAMPSRFTEGEISVPIGISVGVAINPPNAIEISPDDLLRDADKALYRAKTRGKGCYEMASA
jgi:diguanylate cyclase (GGDEF)-like protein